MDDVLLFVLISCIVIAVGVIILLAVGAFKNKDKETPVSSPNPTPPVSAPVDEKQKHLFPLKLQAYERVVLLLERIEPSSLVMRTKTNDMTAGELHGALLNNIRKEYEHNVAQQIYISDNAWNLVKQAKEETIKIINLAANSVDENATGNDLTRKIFENMMMLPQSPSQIALNYIKAEIKELV